MARSKGMLVCCIRINNMSTQGELLKEKRRQKILSRQEECDRSPEDEQSGQSTGKDVFERYKGLKARQKYESLLVMVSRFSGIAVIFLGWIITGTLEAWGIVLLLMLACALWGSGIQREQAKGDDWLTKRFPIFKGLGYVGPILLCLRLCLNSILSLMVWAVVFNATKVYLTSEEL